MTERRRGTSSREADKRQENPRKFKTTKLKLEASEKI
jgi:hypothetical protein